MKRKIHSYHALMRYARIMKFGKIYTKIDPSTGLFSIIAVHNTKLGPANGGCRFYSYSSPESALKDVLRLAYGMTLKAAACDLPHGGAKAVIIKPKGDFDRTAIFRSYGDFVHELNGQYITAVDVGSSVSDMKIISERTPFVSSVKINGEASQDPSVATAKGVFRAIQAAVKFKFKKNNCDGVRIAIQGVGHVGYLLAKHLVNDGAIVTISDVNTDIVEKCKKELNVMVVAPDKTETIDCDIYSPCALGATITHDFIKHTKAKIIAGSANNQLAHHNNARIMQERGIIYLPDFLINSGGLIYVAMEYAFQDSSKADQKIDNIYNIVTTMLERVSASGKTPNVVAEEMAFEKLACQKN